MGPTPFTVSLPFAKTAVGRIAVDPCLRVLVPPKQEGGHIRAEGEAVAGPKKVCGSLCGVAGWLDGYVEAGVGRGQSEVMMGFEWPIAHVTLYSYPCHMLPGFEASVRLVQAQANALTSTFTTTLTPPAPHRSAR